MVRIIAKPFKVYISGCMNSYFNAHNTTYIIHTFLTTKCKPLGNYYTYYYLPNPHIRSPGIGAATAATAGVSVSVIAWRLLVHTDIHFNSSSERIMVT